MVFFYCTKQQKCAHLKLERVPSFDKPLVNVPSSVPTKFVQMRLPCTNKTIATTTDPINLWRATPLHSLSLSHKEPTALMFFTKWRHSISPFLKSIFFAQNHHFKRFFPVFCIQTATFLSWPNQAKVKPKVSHCTGHPVRQNQFLHQAKRLHCQCHTHQWRGYYTAITSNLKN